MAGQWATESIVARGHGRDEAAGPRQGVHLEEEVRLTVKPKMDGAGVALPKEASARAPKVDTSDGQGKSFGSVAHNTRLVSQYETSSKHTKKDYHDNQARGITSIQQLHNTQLANPKSRIYETQNAN